MPANIAPALGFVALAITGGLAVYYWRRSAGLYALLVEGANRFEELRHRNAQLEQIQAKAEEKFKQHREAQARLTQSTDEARAQAAELARKLEAKEAETRLISEKLELQKGHLEKQLAKTQEMLRVAEEQRLDQMLKEKELQAKLIEAEQHKADVESRAKAMDPAELRKLKRKIAQYDRLYSSMKGLREMSEERNRNWEVALRKLSLWVLADGGETRPDLAQMPIGPLVAKSMQAIGAQLIDDHDKSFGAEAATSMDAEVPEAEPADEAEARGDEAP
jgi:hypothetical protein